jgi:hypothetical protein
VSKGCGVATTEDNNVTDKWAVVSTIHNNAVKAVEIASMVDNNSGVIHVEHGDLRGIDPYVIEYVINLSNSI